MHDLNERPRRAVVAAVQLPDVSDVDFESSVAELRQLAKTLGFEVVGSFTQKRAKVSPVTYFGAGKSAEMRRFIRNEAADDAADPADEDADETVAEEADEATAYPTREQRAAAIAARVLAEPVRDAPCTTGCTGGFWRLHLDRYRQLHSV